MEKKEVSLTHVFDINTETVDTTYNQTLSWLSSIGAIIVSENPSIIIAKHHVKFPSYSSHYKLKHFNPMQWDKLIKIEFESGEGSSLVFSINSLDSGERYGEYLLVWWSILLGDFADALGLYYDLPVQHDLELVKEMRKQLRGLSRNIVAVIVLQFLLSIFFAFSSLQGVLRFILGGTLLLGVVVLIIDYFREFSFVENRLRSFFYPMESA